MTSYVKVNGSWKKGMAVWIKINGAWKKQKADMAKPVITRQPVNDTVKEGNPIYFSVIATGEGLRYQWYKDNVAISGATGSAYSVTYNTATAHIFKCRVSNDGGYVDSTPVTGTWTAISKITCGRSGDTYGYGSGYGSLNDTSTPNSAVRITQVSTYGTYNQISMVASNTGLSGRYRLTIDGISCYIDFTSSSPTSLITSDPSVAAKLRSGGTYTFSFTTA